MSNIQDLENTIGKLDLDTITLKNIDYKNLKIIKTLGNGDCFFHAILSAINQEYVDSKDKAKMGHEFRLSLIPKLEKRYNKLSNGTLKEFSAVIPEYSLENMKKTLDSYTCVGHLFNELISDDKKIDIYILDAKTEDVYITGDEYLLHKKRPSLVLYYTGNHYDLLGVVEKGNTIDFFQYDHPFIKCLRKRIKIKKRN